MLKSRYIMVGGFLGAGKTTAILKLAELLHGRGERIGLITNDQSVGLVDTAMLASHGFPTEEITGGCFCCQFNSLIEAAEKLDSDSRPDYFIAEPVGSCTDLRATVSYPLMQMYGERFSIAPLSVLVDPHRAQRVLGLKSGKTFSAKVLYVYEKQLEEADLIVVNKRDLLAPSELSELCEAIREKWPRASVISISARDGVGIEEWGEAMLAADLVRSPSMEVDYDVYAEGEALLGWLNLRAELSGPEFDGNRWLIALAERLQSKIEPAGAEIAHLKMTLTPDFGPDLAVVNVVHNGAAPRLSHELAQGLDAGELLLNLRAELDPEKLRELAVQSLQEAATASRLALELHTVEAFRPGRPVPAFRLS